MNTRKTSSRRWGHFGLTPLALAMAWAGAAHGAEYWLCAKTASVSMPGGVTVPMWGYALDSSGFAGNCAAAATVPGPALVVPAGDNTLTINLRNELTGTGAEPVSIVIPGQAMPATTTPAPVKFPADSQGRQRVRSFTAEATTGGGTQTYTWPTLKPGTYLYHSGTHPQVQVQMGLYGAVKHDAASGQAYTGVPYASEVTLLFSEIDPDLHAAVAGGQYGPNLPVSSTIDYAPQYFLINGKPHTSASPPLAAGAAGQTTLLRLLNAGLQTRSPVLQGMHMRLVAEDGNPYPHAREQYSAFLPALKTVDAVITPAAAATYPIYDRRLAVTNPGASGSVDGGMLARLEVTAAGAGTLVAVADNYSTSEDTPLSVPPATGVLGNDSGSGISAVLVGSASHGGLSLNPDGSFSYAPAANYNGPDSFSYLVSDGTSSSAPATVSLAVNPVNDAPVAAGDAYSVAAGATLSVAAPGVLGNDSDVDSGSLTAVKLSDPAAGTLTFNSNGSFSYVAPAAAGTQSFTYQASDGTTTSAAATVSITVLANRAPVAVADTFAAAVCRATKPATPCAPRATVALAVMTNDSDQDGNLLPATAQTVQIVTKPNKGGAAVPNADGTVSYTPKLNFRGTENFSYRVQDTAGATSNTATVKVNVK